MSARSDGPHSGPAARARRLVGKVARRGASATPAKPESERPARAAAGDAPAGGDRAVADARDSFFRTLELTGDAALAATATTREHVRAGLFRRARTFAQVLQHDEGRLARIGDLCMAIVTGAGAMPEVAWQLFTAADADEVLRVAAAEYLRVAFTSDPAVAVRTLDAIAAGERTAQADARGWLDVARTAFAAGAEQQSRYALRRARAEFAALPDRDAKPLRAAARWLDQWYGRAAAAAASEAAPAGEIPVAVLSYRHPDRTATTRNLGPYFETLAVLSHIARRRDVRLTGDPELATLATDLRAAVTPGRPFGTDHSLRLALAERDATSYSAAPARTWLLVTGLLPRSLFDVRTELPFDSRFRPLFVSVHVDAAESLTPEVVDYLRRHGPVGCRDWPTTLLLLAADVPAYFAGAVTATLDIARGSASESGGQARLFVDTPPDGPGDQIEQEFEQVRNRTAVENLRDALDRAADLAARKRVVTSRLQTYLAARAAGADARLVAENPAQRRFDGLTGLDDKTFAAMQARLTERLADILDAVLAGASEEDVYARWRALCAADVAEAQARRADVPPMPRSAFDIAAACAVIHAASTVVERTAPAPDGSEISVELSLDGNYKHQLEVVLDSIVEHASRPVRAFVLCRDHTAADYDRLAALFPTVSFVWLPTDRVDYGPISGLLGYTTVATMDRLLLPDLLPDLDRIVHHDLDALCLADLAELHDVELGNAPLAGRESPLPSLSSGFAAFMKQAERFRQNPELGRELLRRTHGRHRFDFTVLNAGIMVLNLAQMRADGFGRHFVPFVERFGMNDQSVLNVYAGSTRVEVEPGWNWRPWLELVDEPKIAHWAGKYKPWSEPWVIGKPLWQQAEARLAGRYERAGLSAG